MYSALSYYLSKVLVELPFQIIFPTAMAAIIVTPINLEGRFIFYAVFMTLLNNVGQVRKQLSGAVFCGLTIYAEDADAELFCELLWTRRWAC